PTTLACRLKSRIRRDEPGLRRRLLWSPRSWFRDEGRLLFRHRSGSTLLIARFGCEHGRGLARGRVSGDEPGLKRRLLRNRRSRFRDEGWLLFRQRPGWTLVLARVRWADGRRLPRGWRGAGRSRRRR